MIEIIQKWESHTAKKYIKMDGDKVIYSFTLCSYPEKPDRHIQLEGVYVQPEYRGKGYFNEIMDYVLSLDFDRYFLYVFKGSWVTKKYRELGFRRYTPIIKEDKYEWLRLIKKPTR